MEAVRFIPSHNYFCVLDDFYLQKVGTAVGQISPPAMPTFTWVIGRFYSWARNPFAEHIIFFGRYINHVIMIWQGPETKIHEFITYCKSNPHGITFTSVINKEALTFLDVDLFHDSSGKICSRMHF